MIQKVRVVVPDDVKSHNGPYFARGTRVFVDDKEIKNMTDIVVRYPVDGPVQITLTILASGIDELDFDGFAEVEEVSQ
jgi:hypothetical protein